MKGFLIRSEENTLGTGKVLEVAGDNTIVEYFRSINERIKKTVRTKSLTKVALQKQTRCYLWSEEYKFWEAGRIGEKDELDNTYEVNLPGNRAGYVPEKDIYVRCNLPIDDPLETLVLKSHETPYFHDRRFSFVQCLTRQRAAARGMTGLLSSNVDLYPHQTEVVRRILEDPVQRYLLADEVGLGKTIEAGVILRQYLLDEPAKRAIVLAPKMLVEQWERELEEKFKISHFGDRVYLGSTDELLGLRHLKDTDTLGMLVIDEAHHIASAAYAANAVTYKYYEACQQLSRAAERLLLLSATPVLNNEKDFLAMLHLLDPATYRLDDLDAFRDRITKRQDIGRILMSFREGANPFVLKRSAERLQQVFPQDKRLHVFLDGLLSSLQATETDPAKLIATVRSARNHVSDTYRLHRRMLRNRRESVQLAGRLNTTRAALELKEEFDDDERSIKIHELLDEWRVRAADALASKVSENEDMFLECERELQRIFLLLFRSSGTWLGILKQVLDVRLSLAPASSLAHAFPADDRNLLSQSPLYNGESEILYAMLEALRSTAEGSDRIQLLVDMLKRLKASKSKAVIFTSFEGTHHAILSRLKEVYGAVEVASHDTKRSRLEVEEDVERFRDNADCFVMVSDSSGEEGRNLQFADWLIHFDLPWSPNRLEQRIGRLDRIGRGRSVQTRVLLGPETDSGETIYEAWYQFLKKGLGVFERSIAGLQFYTEEKLPSLEKLIFQSGAIGLLQEIDNTANEVRDEQLKISEQNALDEIDALEKSAVRHFDILKAFDEQHAYIQKATEEWICDVLQFWHDRDDNSGIVRYKRKEGTLVPRNMFLEKFGRSLSIPGTYNRSVASQRRDVNLYRIGESFTDALANYVRWDDRGQAFAMWRHDPIWSAAEGDELMCFRFNFVIDANLAEAKSVLAEFGLSKVGGKSLSRRADALFPPFIDTIYLDVSMQEVKDESVLKTLRRPYNKRSTPARDYSLDAERLSAIEQLIGTDAWPSLCHEARENAAHLMRSGELFREHCDKFVHLAEQEVGRGIDQLRLRLERQFQEAGISASTLSRDLQVEEAISAGLLNGIRNPQLRLDSVGFIVISGRQPRVL